MRFIFIVLLYTMAAGCSTIHTINLADDGVVMKGSYCKSIDHVFSGIDIVGVNYTALQILTLIREALKVILNMLV